jgi:hypothetical protein
MIRRIRLFEVSIGAEFLGGNPNITFWKIKTHSRKVSLKCAN